MLVLCLLQKIIKEKVEKTRNFHHLSFASRVLLGHNGNTCTKCRLAYKKGVDVLQHKQILHSSVEKNQAQ